MVIAEIKKFIISSFFSISLLLSLNPSLPNIINRSISFLKKYFFLFNTFCSGILGFRLLSLLSMDNYICKNDGVLWINVDGLWLKKNKTTKAIEIKNFVLFSDRKYDEYLKRWKLEGKAMTHFVKKDLNAIAKQLENIILQYDGVRELRLVGDGARWIKKLAKKIGAIYYIDKFHYSKTINDLMGTRPPKKHLIYKLIDRELPKKQFKTELIKIVADPTTGEIDKAKIKLIGYLTSNYHYFIRNYKYDNPINAIEAMQAHYQARYFRNQRKGWSPKILDKLITFLNSQHNGGLDLDIDVGHEVNYPLHNGYGIRANIPVIEEPRVRKLIFKTWK